MRRGYRVTAAMHLRMMCLGRNISVAIASKSEAIQTWGLRRQPRLDRVAVARDDELGSAVDLIEAVSFRSLEAVNGAIVAIRN